MALDRLVTFLLTAKPDAATAFYRNTLGFSFLRDDGFALVFDLHGIMLRIAKVPEHTPVQNTVLGWEVEDIHATASDLAAKGVDFERYPNMHLDAQGICTFPNGDKVAWF